MLTAASPVADEWLYTFTVWPDEQRNIPGEVFELFRLLGARVEMPMTPQRFSAFRSALARMGLTVEDVERSPYHRPEPLY
jgi:hypothetical protein